MSVDRKLNDWIDEHNILLDSADYRTGCEIYCNPGNSAYRVREAIRNKEVTE